MATTQSQLDALINARNTGALSCEFDGKRVNYRSLDEMERIIDSMRKDLGLISPGSRFSLASFTKDSSQPGRSTLPDPFGTNQIG